MPQRVRKRPSLSDIGAKLEAKLKAQQLAAAQLTSSNHALRERSKVLLEAISEQGDALHYVAVAAFQHVEHSAGQGGEGDGPTAAHSRAALLTESLMEDLKVFQLLQLVGKTAPSPDEPFTTQCMRKAITPDNVARMRSSSLQDVVTQLQAWTMRLSYLLYNPSASSLVKGSLEDTVWEYGFMGMLLHIAADKTNLELGVLNMDTMERQEPPEGFWESVLADVSLRPEQQQLLCIGVQQYVARCNPIVAELKGLVRRMQQLTGQEPEATATATATAAPATAAPASVTPGINTGSGSSKSGSAMQQDGTFNSSSAMHDSGFNGSGAMHDSGFNSSGAMHDGGFNNNNNSAMQQGDAPNISSAMQQDGTPTNSNAMPQVGKPRHSSGSGGAARSDSDDSSPNSTDSSSSSKPWQQFGLFTGLSLEQSEELEDIAGKILSRVMKLRELHRTQTFLWLNTLDMRQHAISIVRSYPFWSRPLTMCILLAKSMGVAFD